MGPKERRAADVLSRVLCVSCVAGFSPDIATLKHQATCRVAYAYRSLRMRLLRFPASCLCSSRRDQYPLSSHLIRLRRRHRGARHHRWGLAKARPALRSRLRIGNRTAFPLPPHLAEANANIRQRADDFLNVNLGLLPPSSRESIYLASLGGSKVVLDGSSHGGQHEIYSS